MKVNPDVLAKAMKRNIRIEEAKEKAWARERQESQELLSCIEAGMCPICGAGIKTKDNPWRIKRTCKTCGWEDKYWYQGLLEF